MGHDQVKMNQKEMQVKVLYFVLTLLIIKVTELNASKVFLGA